MKEFENNTKTLSQQTDVPLIWENFPSKDERKKEREKRRRIDETKHWVLFGVEESPSYEAKGSYTS